ncbi:MAG: TIR domain-containing protein [Woeseiaceae bacterium]
MKFNDDVFISYAHLDNEPLIKNTDGWVSDFHHSLRVRVSQLLGKESSVWRDRKIKGNDFFDDAIIERVKSAALLVSVFTPRYIRSEWCTRELIQFCDAARKTGGLRVLDKTRVFKVLKTPVPPEQHPEQVRDCIGYEFFRIDPNTDHVREFDRVFGGETERDYLRKLDDLAQDLCQLLSWLEKSSPDGSSGDVSQDKGAVFLANCGRDVTEQRDEVRRELIEHQYRIFPDRQLPLNVDQLIPVLKESLDQCQLSVHVMGKSYGIVPEGTDRSIVELQNELAMERERKGDFSRIVWIPPGLEIDDDRQRRFIESVRSDPGIQEGADLLETPLEDLKTQIHKTLARAATSDGDAESTTSDESSEFPNVYLMCDSRDSKKVKPVADYLFDHGCEVTLPAFQEDEAAVREDNEDNLRRADGVLIYYGEPNELWLRGKLRERRKSQGQGRSKPYKATAILVAPPNSEHDSWLRTHEADVIRQPHEFSTDLLDPFLAALHT